MASENSVPMAAEHYELSLDQTREIKLTPFIYSILDKTLFFQQQYPSPYGIRLTYLFRDIERARLVLRLRPEPNPSNLVQYVDLYGKKDAMDRIRQIASSVLGIDLNGLEQVCRDNN
jgi:hypothetical protein